MNESTLEQVVENYAGLCRNEHETLLETLGRIPAPTKQEDERAVFCKKWFEEQGADYVIIDEAKNVICEYGCDRYEDIVVFMAHMDIVFPDTEELPVRKEGRKVFAPGIGDDTGNLTNLMMAFRYFLKKKIEPDVGILVVANSCEEGLGNLNGSKAIFRKYGARIRESYSFDGYFSECCSSAVGSHRYKVTVRTRGGHSYLDFGNANAIMVLCGMLHDLYEIEAPGIEKTTYNVGYIQGGTTVNSIAQEAYMLYEFRSTAQENLKFMEKKFMKIVEKWRTEDTAVEVELNGIRPGNLLPAGQRLKEFTEKNAKIIQKYYTGEMDYTAFSTDSNIPLSMGIPANTIGTIIGDMAHTREEWIDLDSLSAGLKTILTIMLGYAKGKEE